MNRRLVLVLGLALSAAVAQAAERRPITPHDLWSMKRLGAPELSPDGQRVVLTVQEWSVARNRSSTHLWLVDLAGAAPRRLTWTQGSDSGPAWSPDCSRISFLSKRGEDEANALYLLRLDGGEAEKILELPYPISSAKWLPDGSGLVVATRVIPELAGRLATGDLAAMRKEIKRRRDSKISARVSEDRVFRYWDAWLTDNLAHRLVRVDLATGTLTDLTPSVRQLFTFSGAVSFEILPDGRSVAFTQLTTLRPHREQPNTDVYLVPTDGSGTLRNLTPENPRSDSLAAVSPDGRSLYFTRLDLPVSAGEVAKLWRHDLVTRVNTPLTESIDRSVGSVEPDPDGRTLWLTMEDEGVVPVFALGADGTGLRAVHRQGTAGAVRAGRQGVVFLNATHARPDELFALDPATGRVRQLTRFNEALLAQLDLGRVEEYWFEGAAGRRVQGWLYYPPGFDPGRTYPLVQLMHGGPHTMVGDNWSYRWNGHVFAAAGHVVTWVNRHGSTGFGEAYARSIIGEWGVKPLEDILRSTDHLLRKLPNLDPKRVAAAGASYGGYMAAWIAGHTDRFACIVNHAGVNDFIAQYGSDTTNFSFTDVWGGRPWDNAEGMQRNNPMSYAKNFKTPMLIVHGEKDYRVPYVNGTALYGIYQAMGLPSRLVIFPDENHWILTPQNSIYWNWEVQSWLARWIGGRPTLAEPRFDPEPK